MEEARTEHMVTKPGLSTQGRNPLQGTELQVGEAQIYLTAVLHHIFLVLGVCRSDATNY